MSKPRPVTPLVPSGPGLRYWSGFYSDSENYDALVDDHCFPTVYDSDDDLGRTPGTARREHFQTVAAASPDAVTARPSRGDVPAGSSDSERRSPSSRSAARSEPTDVNGPSGGDARAA